MVLERKGLLPHETLVDFDDEARTEGLIKRILEHKYFASKNVYSEVKAKTIKCRFLDQSVEIATGEDPETPGEFYIVVAENVEDRGEPLAKRKLVLVGSSEELRQLKDLGKMHEYYELSEKLKRKKEVLGLKLFDWVG